MVTKDAFRLAIKVLQDHYKRKMVAGDDKEMEKRLLTRLYDDVKGCSDSSIAKAVDNIIYSSTFAPNPEDFVAAVRKEHLKEPAIDDDAQEKRAGSYEKYGDTKPLTANMKNVIKYMTTGNPTRREWNETIQALYREEKTHDLLGPTAYALLCERQGLDMDKPAFRGGMVMAFGDEPEPF